MYSTKQTAILGLLSNVYLLFVQISAFSLLLLTFTFKGIETVARALWYTGQSVGLHLSNYLESRNEPHTSKTRKVNQSRHVLEGKRNGRGGHVYPKIPRATHKDRGFNGYALPTKRNNYTVRKVESNS